MRAVAAMVAHSAHVEAGLLYVEGAGWEWAKLPALPATANVTFAAVFGVTPDEVDRTPVIRIEIEGPTKALGHVDHHFVVNTIHQIPGTPIHEPRVIELADLTFVEWGLHRLTAVRVEGSERQELAVVEFAIVQA
ncbi:hypothetical protein [Cryptosporangium arvum]|jgi:hypothetical protein|uniref:Uncharacterized protein n=1 Tax=Cryptosporangium arvum DSM 44712 TaxID=927661 RepID=A0A010YNT8_9ACTN|nr:hypothetical protein [Cryptosporangium arvum]EXG81835.1 hypothetical protein CryarDRAFT_2956 [Cryptosporangium arvum DSM 44712]